MILGRDIGLEISRATLDGWVLKVGELLIPMVAAMRRELITGSYIQADETPVDVQMHEGRGKNHQAYLWQYGRPGGSVVFDFRLGRGRDGPKRFLGQFEGILQTDGYTAYDQSRRDENGTCRLLGSCQKTVFRGGAAESTRPGCNSDCGADGRTVCRRRGSSPQSELVSLGVMLCVRKEPSLCWMISVARSRQHSPWHCPPVHSARPANTRSHCGGNLHDSWNIRNLS